MEHLNLVNYEYQVGGSLRADDPTYVTRKADDELYQAIKKGKFCYVLNSRQMGKSSLRVQTMKRLKELDSFACAAIDLTVIGSDKNITPLQWYAGIINELIYTFELNEKFDIDSWWDKYDQESLSTVNFFGNFLRDIVLKYVESNIVIFIDEIDSTLSLDFKVDDFFALIRSFYNHRADNAEYNRLTFVLLGVATPGDLIQDKIRTPFNIGYGVELTGFTFKEALPLAQGLSVKTNQPENLLQLILNWTGGQPFLTQKICALVVNSSDMVDPLQPPLADMVDPSQPPLADMIDSLQPLLADMVDPPQPPLKRGEEEWLEDLIRSNIIENWQSQDDPEHLRTIENRILRNEKLAGELLDIYRKVYQEGELVSQNTPEELKLQLSGLVVKRNNNLEIYNPIYKEVFNQEWIDHQLAELRPYSELFNAWVKSGCQDDGTSLLREKALQEAMAWAKGKGLSSQDHQYLDACQKLEHKRNIRKLQLISLGALIGIVLTGAGAFSWYQYKYASCPIGARIGYSNKCIREIITSGDESKIFIDDINFHLDKGSESFKKGDYIAMNKTFRTFLELKILISLRNLISSVPCNSSKDCYETAKQFFDLAKSADPTDPIPSIYWNNTRARLESKGKPLKLAVVAGIDYYGLTAQEVFRGVADAQNEFNNKGGKNGRLLEIVIVNDGNQPEISKKVAEKLVKKKDIFGIIGHHASESSEAAIPTYKEWGLAIVSPTSSSSALKNEVFFRAIQSTNESAKLYAKYIKNTLHSDKVAIFYDSGSVYSNTLKEDFETKFKGETIYPNDPKDDRKDFKWFFKIFLKKTICPKDDPKDDNVLNQEQICPPNIDELIDHLIEKKVKTVFLIPSVKTNSIARAWTIKNAQKGSKLTLLFAMSLYEQQTLNKGGKSIEGISLATPCVKKDSPYIRNAKERWQQKDIYWRTPSSYDATQAFIEAIKKSSDEPTREEILKNLKNMTLPVEKTSGYGLEWSDHSDQYQSNIKRPYCMYRVENGEFKEVDVEK